MRIFDTPALAADLAQDRVSNRDKAYYLLLGWVLYSAIGYSTLVFANQGRDWLGFFEFFMVAMIAIVGMQSSYEAAGGDANGRFVVDFTCLLVPLTIRVYVVVWGLYWLFAWVYQLTIRVEVDSEGMARLVAFLSRHAGYLATLFAVLATQAALFLRMRVHVAAIARRRGA